MQTLIKYLNNVQLVFIIEKKFQKNGVNAYGKRTIHPSPQTLVKGMTQCQKIMSITQLNNQDKRQLWRKDRDYKT